MTQLYAFTKKAFWQRPGAGPLIEPTFAQPKPGEKEVALDERWINYLRKLNPDKTAFKHIISEDYGPTKGINKNGKLRFIFLAYPGNVLAIDRIETVRGDDWGLVHTLPLTAIPSIAYNWVDHPHLIHKVYGANSKGGLVSLPHAPYVPILGNSRWIEMKWLWRIDVCTVDVRLRVPAQWIYSDKSKASSINGVLFAGTTVTVTGVAVGEHGLWGTIAGGWIPLRYRGSQITNWRI